MLPDLASIHIAGAGPGAVDLDFWNDVYGFSYRPVRDLLLEASLKDAHVAPVHPCHVLTAPCCLRSFDLATMSAADTEFSTEFVLEAASSVSGSPLVSLAQTTPPATLCKGALVQVSVSWHSAAHKFIKIWRLHCARVLHSV